MQGRGSTAYIDGLSRSYFYWKNAEIRGWRKRQKGGWKKMER